MGRQFSWLTNNERRWRIEDISKHEWTKRNIWTLPAKRKYHLQHRSKYNPEYMLCQSNSSMHHYECIALRKDISLQHRHRIDKYLDTLLAMKSEATAIFSPQDGRWKITISFDGRRFCVPKCWH